MGIDTPWFEVVKSPAVKHMTEPQLKAAINLADDVLAGSEDLNALNRRSLDLRGKEGPAKKQKRGTSTTQDSAKRKADAFDEDREPKRPKRSESSNISTYFLPSPPSPSKTGANHKNEGVAAAEVINAATEIDMEAQLRRIADSKLTAFRKQTLSMLCQVPRGRYSTYQAMSDFITTNSHKTCARAVGNAMRNNPFAPEVPCHRIVAADGTLGGFGGHWGEDGKFAKEKHKLLHDEGVRFDSRGKVKGPPFRDFKVVT